MTLYMRYLGSNCRNFLSPFSRASRLTWVLHRRCVVIRRRPRRTWVAINKQGCIDAPASAGLYLARSELVILVLIYGAARAPSRLPAARASEDARGAGSQGPFPREGALPRVPLLPGPQ